MCKPFLASALRIIWEIGPRMQEEVASFRAGPYIADMKADVSPPSASPGAPSSATEPLPILLVPSPILKARAKPVAPEDAQTIAMLVPRMFAAMYAAPGIGLAAPQVGVGLRLVVLDLMADGKSAPITLINPELVSVSDEKATREEGCLSLPGQYADVTRPARVRVRFTDQAGAKQEIEGEGLLAACLQHELDHLDGVLFVDHLSALRRNMILRRLAKERRQKEGG